MVLAGVLNVAEQLEDVQRTLVGLRILCGLMESLTKSGPAYEVISPVPETGEKMLKP